MGAVAAVLWAGLTPLGAQADSGTAPRQQTEAERALDRAKASGAPVEVVGERTETTTTYANPDGVTMRLDESTVPVRVAAADGSWVTPDATLARRADGTVAPRAAAVDLAFSGGGKTPLVTIGRNGRTMTFSWPGTLPAPTLDGDSAVYADVLPDVDLRMTATTQGYREVLVVRTPKAAADPRLKRIAFGLRTSGLDVGRTADGGFAAIGPDGQQLFTSPAAQMWDSHGTGAEAAKNAKNAKAATGAAKATPGTKATPGVQPQATPADSEDGTDGPAPGATSATTPLDLTASAVTVVPDPHLLASTDTAAYPLYIDPDVSLASGSPERTLLRSDGYKSYGWANGTNGEGDGHCGTWDGYYCGPGYTQRLYFQFTPGALKGKKVLKATFRVTSPWAFQCAARWTDLERTNNFSSSTTWSSRPAELDLMVDRSFSAGRGSSCDPNSPAAPIEFADNPDETNENLTPTVANFAAGKFAKLTLELRAHDESDTSAWKRFKNDATLSVNYVANPALPTKIGLVTGSGTVCSTKSADPSVISDPTPALSSVPQTAAGGESGARLRSVFSMDKYTASTATWSSAFADIVRPTSGFVGDNVSPGVATAPTLTDGTLYRYRTWTRSYYDNQTSYLSGPSNGSTTGWCYFKVDSTAPKAPSIAFTSTYSECLPNSCLAAGGPGVAGTLTFGPASGDSNVAYEYKLSSGDAWIALPNGQTSVTVKPPAAGTYHLDVRAKDVVGRWGAETVKDFLVAAGAGPVAQWNFDESSGQAIDTSTTVAAQQHNATLSTGATRDDNGRRGDLPDGNGGTTPDKGLRLDGTSGYASTAGPVLETRSAYTVSAWVKLDTLTPNAIVLSQDGVTYSPFILGYDHGLGTWFFGVKQQDANTGTAYYGVASDTPAKTGIWTQLVGSYDPSTQQSTLYVNGVSQGSATVTGSWSATGPFQIGRYKWGTYQYNFPGSIDEVKVWQRALTPQEASDEARLLNSDGKAQVELTAAWDPSGATGSTLTDTASGYGRTLTTSGGATLDGTSLVLNGTDGAAGTPGPVIDDTGSFTVTTEVSLDSGTLAAEPVGSTVQVTGQRTADGSSWGLWYQLTGTDTDPETDSTVPVGFWHFGRLNADGTFTGVTSDEPAAAGTPVRLTGIFDAQDGTVRLFVGDNQNGTDQEYAAAAGSGDFAVGRGPSGTGWGHYLPGSITDLRIWAGAMTDQQQIVDTVGD
ncbi:Concanavalin A-like lectin/glucanases superfamily protein [Actinacidiphila alni]|uniref:Concanavalin A-like lectin/glucanases superfamily protein n=1 Tax=Actinacidiphila alni TaxID=380248 RepID=A0A1I2F961_9ACTN|nr:LamG-like jellyroll fold domain-containing protein [Actinacidiphila alni]SFF01337.1 Concanavalin A-like lectin/glucanases superfamily protein [Actinacidiphila alni]